MTAKINKARLLLFFSSSFALNVTVFHLIDDGCVIYQHHVWFHILTFKIERNVCMGRRNQLILFLKGEVAFILFKPCLFLRLQIFRIVLQLSSSTTSSEESPSNDMVAILAVYTVLSTEVMQFVPIYQTGQTWRQMPTLITVKAEQEPISLCERRGK